MNEKKIIVKSFKFDEINDDVMRKFECWGSVEVVDRQREIIPAEEVYKIMDVWVDRGAPIMFNHTNRQVGKGLNWRPAEKNGVKGVLITGIIYNHYKEDDEIWEGIKKGEFEGLSIGGKSFSREKDENGNTLLRNLIGYEFSVVSRTGNQEATFVEVNEMAKSGEEVKKDEEKQKMDENIESSSEDEISQLKNIVESLIEKISTIEEKISGIPETDEDAIEKEEEEDEKKEDEKKDDVTKSIEKEMEDLKKEIVEIKNCVVTKSIETKRPEENHIESKYSEVRKAMLENVKKNGKINFSEIKNKIGV